MNAVAAIVRANLRRMRNDRSNIFFIVVLPLLIVFALGTAIAGSAGSTLLGVVDPHPTQESNAVRTALAGSKDVSVESVATAKELRDRVARGLLDAGWVVHRSGIGPDRVTTLDWVSGVNPDGAGLQAAAADAARVESLRHRAVQIVASDAGVDLDRARAAVDRAAPAASTTDTRTGEIARDRGNEPAAIRGILAAGQLALFMFLTSLFGASALLLSRQYGVTQRTRAAPVSNSAIIAGEALSRYLVALIQAAIILVGSSLMFGVDWRSPVTVIALCAAMALVGSGVAMILGTIGRSEQQVGALAMLLGLVMAALGGSMQPLEFFPDTMRTIAFAVTPHAWMNDAMWSVLVDGAGIAGVWVNLAVLTGIGAVLLVIASRLLARSLR